MRERESLQHSPGIRLTLTHLHEALKQVTDPGVMVIEGQCRIFWQRFLSKPVFDPYQCGSNDSFHAHRFAPLLVNIHTLDDSIGPSAVTDSIGAVKLDEVIACSTG